MAKLAILPTNGKLDATKLHRRITVNFLVSTQSQ